MSKEAPRYTAQRAAMQASLMQRLVDRGYGLSGYVSEKWKRYIYMALYGASWTYLCRSGAPLRDRTGTP